MLWKQTTVRVLVYTVKASLCYSHNEIDRPRFPAAELQQLTLQKSIEVH